MKNELEEINMILLGIANSISGKNETMEDIENDFIQSEFTESMVMFSKLGGKIIHGGVIDPDKYIKAEDVIESYEFG